MEGTKPRTANSLGMFDFLKGIGMLTIVFAHSAELYPVGATTTITPMTFYLFAYRESLMAAFYIASGYGFRKRSIGKCISQQFKTLFKPYAYTGLATTIAHFVIHYKTFGNWNNAVYETYKVLGGFVLGLPHTATYFGQEFFSCGPMWYLLSLMIAWVLLDLILNIFPERYIPWAVGGAALLGWGASLVWELPFCLIQGAVITPYLYLGYLAKRQHWLDQPLSRRMSCILWAAVLLIPAAALATRRTDCVSMAEWSLGPISILLDGLAGLLFIRLFLRWSQRRNPLVRFFEAIGRRSLYIFCVHTVELIAIPWYLFAAKYADRPVLGISLQYILSLGSIWLICALLQRRRDLIIKLFPARRRTPQVHYAPRH